MRREGYKLSVYWLIFISLLINRAGKRLVCMYVARIFGELLGVWGCPTAALFGSWKISPTRPGISGQATVIYEGHVLMDRGILVL